VGRMLLRGRGELVGVRYLGSATLLKLYKKTIEDKLWAKSVFCLCCVSWTRIFNVCMYDTNTKKMAFLHTSYIYMYPLTYQVT
jgi:hypothetical protein